MRIGSCVRRGTPGTFRTTGRDIPPHGRRLATNTLVHNQLLDEQCSILTEPTSQGIAQGLVEALTNPTRVEGVVREAEQFLRRYCSQPARDAAYGGLFAAVAATKRA